MSKEHLTACFLLLCWLIPASTSYADDAADEWLGPEPIFVPDECLIPLKAEIRALGSLGRDVTYTIRNVCDTERTYTASFTAQDFYFEGMGSDGNDKSFQSLNVTVNGEQAPLQHTAEAYIGGQNVMATLNRWAISPT